MSTAADRVVYLNPIEGAKLMEGGLLAAVQALPAKLQKQPAAQWSATIKALVSKGVKQAEIDDCEILTWLQASGGSLTRAEVEDYVRRRQVTVKEVTLGSPRWRNYSHYACFPAGTADYKEVLFIANSERANMEDRLEQIDYEMEAFALDMEMLEENPERLLALSSERARIMLDKPKSYDFAHHHFSSAIDGKHGKNLLVHSRVITAGDLFFVSEIQSDWGQRGRRADWQGIPKGPFVTETKLWAGLAVRRLLQQAALNPAITRFSWIRGSMRNGGKQVTADNLDDFYLKTVGGIIDKVVAKTGQKCRLANLAMGGTIFADVPTLDITPEVREICKNTLPLYSRAAVHHELGAQELDQISQQALAARAAGMLGGIHQLHFVRRLYEISDAGDVREVAGRQINRMIEVSLYARDAQEVLDHESFHFACEHLMRPSEVRLVEAAFAPGTRLNDLVVQTLARRRDHAAAAQCTSAQEAAAHGFALWSAGFLRLSEAQQPVRGLFQQVRQAFLDALSWFRRTVQGESCTTVQEVFERLRSGGYSAAAQDESEQSRGRRCQPMAA